MYLFIYLFINLVGHKITYVGAMQNQMVLLFVRFLCTEKIKSTWVIVTHPNNLKKQNIRITQKKLFIILKYLRTAPL